MKAFSVCCIILLFAFFQVSAQIFGDLVCYTIAHNNGHSNVLFKFNPQTNQWIEIGLTGTHNMKAIATDPTKNTLYAVDGHTFGTINPKSGLFSSIGTIGQANGEIGPINLNDIEGLTFDHLNNIMYATQRVQSGVICNPTLNSNDLLFQIDITTGKHVPDAMLNTNGQSADYAVIEDAVTGTILDGCTNQTLNDVNDIAYNAYTGELYAIQNQEYVGLISIINPADASVESVVYDYADLDLIGLAFSSIVNCFKYINLQDQLTSNLPFIDPSGTNFDFRSLACVTPSNDLALSLTIDPNSPSPIAPEGAVTFLITVYNQGELDNNSIYISNYIPEGLQLNDSNWTRIPGTNIAIYEFNELLAPSLNATIPISFIVDANFAGDEIINSAEITTSFNNNVTDFNGNPLPLTDIDSRPDDTNNELLNGGIIVDDAINQAGPNVFLLTTLSPATCNGTGAAEIKILDNGNVAPYTHKWLGSFGELVHLQTNSNLTHTVTDLPADIYNVVVSDAAGKVSVFVVTIPLMAANSGNLNCNNSCPEYLSTPNELLYGVFQSEGTIDINGEITRAQGAEFRICN